MESARGTMDDDKAAGKAILYMGYLLAPPPTPVSALEFLPSIRAMFLHLSPMI